ncbi:hypothetical protein CAL7716_100620 (plasmid) [Calothrix sp. PCC 7716]|nr:hypothetical protein CAL7716_100620 [Calothrix sp. PCC 7716]
MGGCRTAIDTELNVLIVDDITGENGGIIEKDQAYKLTGDCYGQISDEVYRQLTGHQDGDKYRVIQHRFGWTPEDGDDDKHRFGKGTFRPANLNENTLDYTSPSNKPKIDVVIPLSSFKGTDKDNPNGASKPQIKPGLYKQKVWIGEKSQSELGKTAISQVVASFPKGMKDFTEIIELEAQKLAEAQKDPRKLAQLYCEKYEKRKEFLEEEATNLENEITTEFDQDKQNNLDKLRERLNDDSFIYKIIKADLAADAQLLETEKVKNALTEFVQNEWRDIAIGKKLTFERALVIPSKDLKNGEICIPKYENNEEVLNFRSPFLNSNGMCVSTNKLVDDMLGPDGNKLEGIIVVSDETSEKMYKRISSEIEKILPDAKSQNIKLDGIENYLNNKEYDKKEIPDKIQFTDKLNEYIATLNKAGYNIDLLPYESEQERQARDYDGDCIGFEKASKYPNLAQEAIERNTPENAYLPTIKEKKQSFYNEDGTQPSFERIAKHMSDGISVGVINNHLTSIEALESEQEIIKLYGSSEEKIQYVSEVAKHYYKTLKRENPKKEYTIIPEKYKEPMREFTKLAYSATSNNSPELALQAMAVNKEMYRELIADAAYQNQIAVDLFKSAKSPDMKAIRQNSRLLHREVNYIKDKKGNKVYDTETINPTGQSPVELLIAKTNQYFRSSQLESREISQFKDLFKDVEFTNNQRLRATLAKKEFDTVFTAASMLSRRRETEKGPSIDLTLPNDIKLDVTNLLDAKHPDVWKAKTLKIKVQPIDEDKVTSDSPHKYEILAQINGAVDNEGKDKYLKLGNISKEQEYGLIKQTGTQFGQVYNIKNFDFQPALSEGQVKLMFDNAYEIAQTFYQSIPEDEKLSMAAATWAVSTTKFAKDKSQTSSELEESETGNSEIVAKKTSTFVFAAFEQEVISRVENLQFSQTKLTNIDKNSPIFQQEKVEVRYNIDTNGKDIIEVKNQSGEYEYFGNLEAETGRMPIGTTAEAQISYKDIYSANITTQIPGTTPVTFKITELIKHDLGQQYFDGKELQELEIRNIHRPIDTYTINIKDGNKFIKVGNIDESSIKEGIEQGWLPEKTGVAGAQLKLKITQIVSSNNSYAVGETPEGNLLRVNLHKDFKNANLNNAEYSDVYMKAYSTSNIYVATIKGEAIGLIGEHKEVNFPQRTHKQPSLVQQLINNKVIEANTTTTTIPVKVESKISAANVSLNQESIKYPEEWIKRLQLLKYAEKQLTEQESKANNIIAQINARDTLIFQDSQQKKEGVFGIAVDKSNIENTKKYLELNNIKYAELPASQTKLEDRKGMSVLIIDESSVSTEKMKSIFLKDGRTIKNSDVPSKLPIPKDQLVYFTNPKAEYGDKTKSAVGFVVPTKDADTVQSWMENFRASVSQLTLGNTTIVMATSASVNKQLENILSKELGKPLDVSITDGYDKYETATTKLKEVIAVTDYTASQAITKHHENEYYTVLKQYANRPKALKAEEEEILPLAPVAPSVNESLPQNYKNVYELTQEDRFYLPVGSTGIENATQLDDSPTRPSIALNFDEHMWLDYGKSTVIAVDFREIENARELLHLNAISFDEAVGMSYIGGYSTDELTSFLSNKGYYTFIIKNEDVSQQELEYIKQSLNVQNEFNSQNETLIGANKATNFLEQLPNAPENINNILNQYIEDKDLFLSQWHTHVQNEAELYVSPEYPPTQNLVYFIGKIQSLSMEEINQEAKQLNVLETAWLKLATETDINCPYVKEGEEWNRFLNSTLFDNFNKISTHIEKYTNTQTATPNTQPPEQTQQSNILDTKVGIIVQQINPKAETIGNGFNQSLAEKYPNVAKKFEESKETQKGVNFVRINDDLYVAQIASQISSDITSKQTDFNKLTAGLKEIADFADKNNLPVYIPQGLAVEGKGKERLSSWDNVKSIIHENLPSAEILLPNQDAINDIKERNKLTNAPPTENLVSLIGKAEELSQEKYDTAINYLSPNELKWVLVNSGLGSESLPDLSNEKERKLIYKIFETEYIYDRLLQSTASRISDDVLTQITNLNKQLDNATTAEEERKADNTKSILVDKYGEKLYSLLEEKAEQKSQLITLPSSQEANKNTPIEIMGTISTTKIEEIRQHLEANYIQLLETDVSNYSPGRQVGWVGAKWELNNKTFSSGVQDKKLMELLKQVYPDGDIALVTYSPNPGQGINYHRDDSYAANEARSINIGNSEWGYQPAKSNMEQSRDEKANTPVDEFKLASGTVTRFHSKNAHAALNTEAGRWSINIWSIKDLSQSKEIREKYNNFLQSNQPARAVVTSNKDLTIKTGEWAPGGTIQVDRQYPSIAAAELAQIIRIGNNTQQNAKSPNIPDSPKISGKPVTMAWDLTNPDKNAGATTTIDAMRGKGRVHSTRSENYYEKYGIKEGDIALAEGKDGKQVAFRVGKQYKITKEMIGNPDYQRAWVNWEKHNVSELLTRQSKKIDNKQPLYGLFMEPLGDYTNGKIVPFSSVEIGSAASSGIGAVLNNATSLAKNSGNLTSDYEISINGNPEAPAGKYGRETHQLKPAGAPYKSAEHAYEHQKQTDPNKDTYKLMVEVLQAKLEQHPRIASTITKLGGIDYLEKAKVTNQNDNQWEGIGKESKFIRALSEAYTNVIQKTQSSELLTKLGGTEADTSSRFATLAERKPFPPSGLTAHFALPPKTTNPLASLAPLNERVAKNMPKDIAMAEVATQFIGKSAAPLETPSSTRNYTEAWNKLGLANTGKYTKNDTIMVSANGPWRGVTMLQIEQIFKKHYEPLLSKGVEAKASFVLGTADGGDQLIKKFLQENGYKLTDSGKGYLVANVNEKVKDSNTTEPPQEIPTKKTTPPQNNQTNNIAPGIVINSRSTELGAALTSTTVKSKALGAIDKDYPVSFRDNIEVLKNSVKVEPYTEDKPKGAPFASLEQAFQAYKESVPLGESRVNLLAEIQQARFEQHPDLLQAVKDNGGVEWLKQCEYKVGSKNEYWEGKGEESKYIRSLIIGYEKAIQNTIASEQNQATNNEHTSSTPPAPKEKNKEEDKVTIKTPNVSVPTFDTTDDTIEQMRAGTLLMLTKWQEVADKLGRDERYVKRIGDIIESYQNRENLNLDKAFPHMKKDMNELETINDITMRVQHVVRGIGGLNTNTVKTKNGYQFAIDSNSRSLLAKDENNNTILLIKDGKVKTNAVNENFIKDLKYMNFQIDSALTNVKTQLTV